MARPSDGSRTMRIDIRGHTPAAEARDMRKRASGGVSAHLGRSEYERLLYSVYDGVLITDNDGIVREFNRRAVEFLAHGPDELEGAGVLDFISGSSSELLEGIQENLEQHRYTLIEAYCRRTDGTLFPAEIAVNRVDLGEGRDLVFFIRDVTVRRQAEDARERAMARLEELDQARSQFVANVSHELRTPLTSMIYAVANLLRGVAGPLSDKVREYLELLDGNCRRLLGTVNDILDLRKLESNSLVLSRTKVPLALVVEKAVKALSVQARQKHIELQVHHGERRCFVNCDVAKMERVVLNVVGNAIKFTSDHGEVAITFAADEAEGMAVLTVRDNGVGIPESEIANVMRRYYTVGEQPCGSGLGLAIAKEIVDLHGGSIRIVSPCPGRDKGTVITVTLPMVASARVFLASGCEEERRRLTRELRRQGYLVTPFESATLLPDRLAGETPDLVLVDLSIEAAAARDVLLEMRSSRKTMRIPLLALVSEDTAGETAAILKGLSIPTLSTETGEGAAVESVAGTLFLRATAASEARLTMEPPTTTHLDPTGNT